MNPHPFDEQTLAYMVRKIRDRKNIKQGKLAEEVGVSQAFISNIEKGKNTPSVEMLYNISLALGVNIADFFPEQHLLYWLPIDVIHGLTALGPGLEEEEKKALTIVLRRYFNSIESEKREKQG